MPDSDSDDGKTKSESDCDFHYPKWRVWSHRSDGVPCEQLIALNLNDASKHPDKICKSRPVGVRHNANHVSLTLQKGPPVALLTSQEPIVNIEFLLLQRLFVSV